MNAENEKIKVEFCFFKKLRSKETEENVNEICLIERIEIMKMNFRCEISIDQKFIEKRSCL